jgi:hypothetical protein
MKRSKVTSKAGSSPRLEWSCALLAALGLVATLGAQTSVPFEDTMALQGTMKSFYRAANTIVVTTVDGVEHVYHFTRDLVVHGGKGSGIDALRGLPEGATVAVHYHVRGGQQTADEVDYLDAQGLEVTEGVLTNIDRRRKEITIQFDDGKKETFRLTDRAAVDAGKDIGPADTEPTRIVIYYADESGEKVAHFFTRTPVRTRSR